MKKRTCFSDRERGKTIEEAKNIKKLVITAITQENMEMPHIVSVNLRYKTQKEIPMVFHNGSNHEYHFTIRELAGEFEEQFEWLGENIKKYITFSVPIKKENGNSKAITYNIEFINSVRFMSNSLSSMADNLAKGIHKDKCKNFKSDLQFMTVNDDTLVFNCINYKKIMMKSLMSI